VRLPGFSEFVTVTSTVLPDATENAPDGLIDTLSTEGAFVSVTVQLEPAGMLSTVLSPVPVMLVWYVWLGSVQVMSKLKTVLCWLAGATLWMWTLPGDGGSRNE
jgi:hypothetical protein